MIHGCPWHTEAYVFDHRCTNQSEPEANRYLVYADEASDVARVVKGKLRSKKGLAQMKEREKCKTMSLNAPSGSRDIPFQSQEFEQDRHRHFVDF